MRTYVTPTLLNKFDPKTPDICVKCGDKGTLMQCLWECSEIQKFWKEVSDVIARITSVKLNPCPKLCILGIFPTEMQSTACYKQNTYSQISEIHY